MVGPQGRGLEDIVQSLMGLPTGFDTESERRLLALQDACARQERGEPVSDAQIDALARSVAERGPELGALAAHQVRLLRRKPAAARP